MSELVVQTIAPDLVSYAPKLAADGDSVLSLSSHDFEAGLASIRADATSSGANVISEPIDVFVFR